MLNAWVAGQYVVRRVEVVLAIQVIPREHNTDALRRNQVLFSILDCDFLRCRWQPYHAVPKKMGTRGIVTWCMSP